MLIKSIKFSAVNCPRLRYHRISPRLAPGKRQGRSLQWYHWKAYVIVCSLWGDIAEFHLSTTAYDLVCSWGLYRRTRRAGRHTRFTSTAPTTVQTKSTNGEEGNMHRYAGLPAQIRSWCCAARPSWAFFFVDANVAGNDNHFYVSNEAVTCTLAVSNSQHCDCSSVQNFPNHLFQQFLF